MLAATSPERAARYFESIGGQVESMDAQMQLALIHYVHEHCPSNLAILTVLLEKGSTSVVQYEAASALKQLSHTTESVKAVANCYIELIVRESDNNTRLVMLGKLKDLQTRYSVVNDSVMDLMRALRSSDAEVKSKVLELVSLGVTVSSAHGIIDYLYKELRASDSLPYKKSLLQVVRTIGEKSPSAALKVLFLAAKEEEGSLASFSISLAKGLLELVPAVRMAAIEDHVLSGFDSVDEGPLARLLWLVGEYCQEATLIEKAMEAIKRSLGHLPFSQDDAEDREADFKVHGTRTVLNADGTYATESAMTSTFASSKRNSGLRGVLMQGNFGVAPALAMALVKLCLAAKKSSYFKKLQAESILIITSVLRLGLSSMVETAIPKSLYDRVMLSLRILAKPDDAKMVKAFVKDSHDVLGDILRMKKSEDLQQSNNVDTPCAFRLAEKTKRLESQVRRDYLQAVSGNALSTVGSALSRVVQLTGLSDPIYAETYVALAGSEVLLDILLVNQTDDTLQNVQFDLSTTGDLQVTDKPLSLTLSPRGYALTKASVKVNSTNNGAIFGCITHGLAHDTIFLANIHLDVVDYICSSTVLKNEDEFRRLWVKLEWENKVVISSKTTTLQALIELLMREVHFACLTEGYGVSESGDYLAANLGATSAFGEDILANLCLVRDKENMVTGHLRLRSKTKGIAVALGETITRIVAQI